jgi:aminopeptidase N
MKRIFLALVILFNKVNAQIEIPLCKSTNDIANNERNAFLRTFKANRSFASSNFQVTYYRCVWDIDPSVRFIKGNITSHFITNASANSITFDLSSQLTVDSVYFHKGKIGFSRPGTDLLQINFSTSINAGQKDSVTIFYKGVPPNTGFGSFNLTTHSGVPVLWTLSEPYGSKEWWPCRNGVDDKADSIDIIISCPNAYRISSNGMLVNESDNGITRTAFYKHRYPVASYLVAFAVTNFKVLNHSVQLGAVNLPMITYCYPENENSFQQNTVKVLNALSLYHQNFGPYPFINERYGHTQFSWGGGMEHQTNSFIVSTDENLMAHELGHQWFGDKVTCGSWQDIWLNEGFATFLSYFYFEKIDPGGHLNRIKNLSSSITNLPDGSVWVNDTTNLNRIFDGRLSYNKGAYLLHMLRWVLGDTVFFNGLRQYISDPKLAYGFARTDDLKRNLERISGKNLSEFFNDWFTGQGYPSYTVKWSQNINNWAKINLSQAASHPSVSFFEMPLALKFKNSTQQKTVVVNNTKNNEIFWEDIGFKADTVLIDPDYWVLSRNNVSVKENNLSAVSNELKIYPVPATTVLTVELKNPTEKKLDLHIYAMSGQLLSSKQIATPGRDELFQINISHLPRGVYLLRFSAGNFKMTKRIIKI